MNNPEHQHHRSDYPEPGESEMNRIGYHPAPGALRGACRFIFDRRISLYTSANCPPNLAYGNTRITLRLDELSRHSVAPSQCCSWAVNCPCPRCWYGREQCAAFRKTLPDQGKNSPDIALRAGKMPMSKH